jgi:hypothetical protein
VQQRRLQQRTLACDEAVLQLAQLGCALRPTSQFAPQEFGAGEREEKDDRQLS